MPFEFSIPPCVLHEDEHLLVVNKPAGMNTHAPSAYAGEGLYDWLKHREPRWARLAIIHRLDKETSGIIVFAKSTLANRSLTEQFTQRAVVKRYAMLTDKVPEQREWTVKSRIARTGERYASVPQGELAETRFRSIQQVAGFQLLKAEPTTGRTHQIRVHAAENGFPILGDALYGGASFSRVCLHASEIRFQHPENGKEVTFSAAVDFFSDAHLELRHTLIAPVETNAVRLVHGESDGWPGWYVERLGPYLLSQGERPLTNKQLEHLTKLSGHKSEISQRVSDGSAYHKILNRQLRRASSAQASPCRVFGPDAPDRFVIRENAVQFELSFNEGYSIGLFLDQRDNRRRLLSSHVAAGFELPAINSKTEVLNTFAYTCGFSVCAAKAGARTTSLDLSKKYLEWGKRNFLLNGTDPAEHDFIFGDAFDWMRRLTKKGRRFDIIVLDPPTFSQSREQGAFRVDKDYGKLVSAALSLLKPTGVLFASTNAADWEPEKFLASVTSAIQSAHRRVLQQHYVPQPPDFPVSRAEPAYLKTCWFRVS